LSLPLIVFLAESKPNHQTQILQCAAWEKHKVRGLLGIKGSRIKVACSNLKPLMHLWFSLTVNFRRFLWGNFLDQIFKRLFSVQLFLGVRGMWCKD
jgi:hypothetical protein